MVEYFHLQSRSSRRLTATNTVDDDYEVTLCPITSGWNQHRSCRRIHDLAFEVSHRKRDEQIIWSFEGPVFHNLLLDELQNRGFTGFRRRPATVRFRDGFLSSDYSELIVAGWGGLAPLASGIHLLEECPACGYRKYSGLEEAANLVDWSQWSGDDFFIVWPLPRYIMITKRAADTLASLGVRTYDLHPPSDLEKRAQEFAFCHEYSVGRVSQFMPQDIALKYGQPLGLE